MKRVVYSGVVMSQLKGFTLLLISFVCCFLSVKSQITYLSTFEDPTGEYNATRPSCLLNALPPSIDNPQNISTATLTDYATLSTTIANATLACNGVYLVNANLNLAGLSTISASGSNPYYVGFKVRVSSALLTNLIGGGNDGIVVKTYQDGVPVQSAGANAIGLSLLQGNVPGNVSFTTTQPFNQVAVEVNSGILSLGLASSFDFFYAFASTAQVPIILPVKLTSFLASATPKSVAVSWVATLETNVAKYELQRSSDGGATFGTIAVIAVKGNATSETTYNYVDGTALSGSYIYRLKIIDKDNKAEFSKLALVKVVAGTNWKIYPTLLNSGTDLNISFSNASSGKTQIQLANLQGQILRNASTATDTKLTVNTNGLSSGVYVLKLYKDGQLQTSEKVVIQ